MLCGCSNVRKILFIIMAFILSLPLSTALENIATINLSKEIMVDSGTKLINQNNFSITLLSSNTSWFSFSIDVELAGYYELKINSNSDSIIDIFVDGKTYNGVKNIYLAGTSYYISPPFYLDKGQHSVIILSKNIKKVNKYGPILVRKLKNAPTEYIDTQKSWQKLTNYSRVLEIGDMFGGSYINVNVARDMAMFSRNNQQYISYYNSNGYLVVGKRNLNSTYFEKYWLPTTPVKIPFIKHPDTEYYLSDPHYFISMQMDGAGYIHLAYGHHKDKLRYFKTVEPYDISAWVKDDKLENIVLKDKITYVRFLKLKNGDLLVLYRNSKPDELSPKITVLRYNLAEKNWNKIHESLITYYGNGNAYLWRPVVSLDGTIHLIWTWRIFYVGKEYDEKPGLKYLEGLPNEDISYAKSNDSGETWHNSDGMQYLLPLTREGINSSNAEVIVDKPIGEGMFNHFGSDYDSSGNPHFVYTRWNNQEDKVIQQWHLYWNGTTWNSNIVTNYQKKVNWNRLQQIGKASTYVTRPSIVVAGDNTALVLSRTVENDNKIELYFSNGSNYNHWNKQIIFNGSMGGWEPQMDLDLWHEKNLLQLIILGITDKAVEQDFSVNFQEYNIVKVKIVTLLKKFGLWRLYSKIKGRTMRSSDFYSPNFDIKTHKIDRSIKEDTGYILEVDYNKLKTSEINEKEKR